MLWVGGLTGGVRGAAGQRLEHGGNAGGAAPLRNKPVQKPRKLCYTTSVSIHARP